MKELFVFLDSYESDVFLSKILEVCNEKIKIYSKKARAAEVEDLVQIVLAFGGTSGIALLLKSISPIIVEWIKSRKKKLKISYPDFEIIIETSNLSEFREILQSVLNKEDKVTIHII